MKILHWDEMFHPSFGYQINILPKFQALQGHEVTIMTSDDIKNHPTFKSFSEDVDIHLEDKKYEEKYGIKVVRLPIHRVVSGRVIYKKGYIKRIIEENADVIMCHTNDTLSSIRIAQKYKEINKPIVFDNHMLEMASKNPLSKLFRIYFRKMITPKIVKNKWKVIRTQEDDYVNKHLKIPKDQTPFLSFGSDTTLFYPNEETKKLKRETYGIHKDDFVVIYTGKLSEEKGGLLLAESFVEKFKTKKNVVLLVVGNTVGNYGETVEEVFRKSKNKVVRVPTQTYENLPQFYQMSDLSVFPKQCSLSFYDAQACGLPVVSEDNNINVDRLDHNNGFNFSRGSIKDFRDKIEFVVNMPEDKIKEMSANSLKYIQSNFDYKDIASQYTDILDSEVERFREMGTNG